MTRGITPCIVVDDQPEHIATHFSAALPTQRQPHSRYCRLKYGNPDRTTGIWAFGALASLANTKMALMIFAALSLAAIWDATGLDVVEGQAHFTLKASSEVYTIYAAPSPWPDLAEKAAKRLACLPQK